jgi:hypothetical protein
MRLSKQIFFILSILLPFQLFCQVISGKIIDANNKQGIPFAFIGYENSNNGTTADIDGDFKLKLDSSVSKLMVQIIGYHKTSVDCKTIDPEKELIIKLTPSEIKLLEVIVRPKENPANELIRKLIRNKPNLDPRNLPFYACETYGKTYFTMSDQKGNEFYYKDDTSKYGKEQKFLEKQYLFFIETASEKKYIYKNITQEKILASRVSGFKTAPFASLASQLQSFTFFDKTINVLDINYVNPIQKGTFKRYNFEITDTIIQEQDTTILIAFSPRKGANFKALKGTLYLNKNQYALANVIAEPLSDDKKSNTVKIQQRYSKINNKQWFPTQLVTEILFNNVAINSKPDENARVMKCVSRLYVSDVNLDSTIQIKKKNIEVINDKGYEKKSEEYWKSKRTDSLTQKEKNTYTVVDSVGKAQKFESRIKLVKILSTGQIPVGFVSFDIRKFIKANDYEGIRLGAGLLTNDKLFKWASVGGYAGYGFNDRAWKYGGHLQINLNESKSINIKTELARDLQETANTSFLGENTSLLSTQNIRNYLVGMMDQTSFGKVSFNTPINHFIKSSFYFSVMQRTSRSGYGTEEKLYADNINIFTSNEAGVQLKIWPFEKFTESFMGLLSLGSNWPCFYINYAEAIPVKVGDYTNSFSYRKIDIMINHRIPFKVRGFVNYQIKAGKVFGDVPYSFQSNNNGSRINKYYISAENSFETMYFNEFISTHYAAFFAAYNTGKVFKQNKYCNPEFELVHNIGYGELLNREKLTYITLSDISKVYTEAGIRVKSLYKNGVSTFGVGAFYRYGNYALSDFKGNFVFKFVLGFDLN